MKKNTLKRIAFTTSLTLIIAGALIAINIASSFFFTRLDLTSEKTYTISQASKNVARDLKDQIEIRGYISKQLSTDLNEKAQYAKDLLAEYASLTNKISVTYVDPGSDADKIKAAQEVQIPQLEFQVLEKDQFKVQKGFLGIAFINGEKKEAIPVLQDISNLEYEITSIIKRLTSEGLPKIGFVTGHGESGINQLPPEIMAQLAGQEGLPNSDFGYFAQGLQKNYETVSVDLKDEKSLIGIEALVIGGPTSEFQQVELYNIDQYLMHGGKALFLVPKINVDLQKGLQAEEVNASLAEFIANYGIQINTDVVIDKTNETVAFNSGNTGYYLPYPFWPKLTERSFNPDHPATRQMQTATLPFISSLSALNKDEVKTTVLATSSPVSTIQISPFNLQPNQQINYIGTGNRPLIVEASGRFESYYKSHDFPKIQEGRDVTSPIGFIPQATVDGTIIVMANNTFLTNDYLQKFPSNFALGQNLIDYLASDSDLISIRAKTPNERPIQTPSDSQVLIVKGINIIGIPLLILAIGMLYYYRRIRQ